VGGATAQVTFYFGCEFEAILASNLGAVSIAAKIYFAPPTHPLFLLGRALSSCAPYYLSSAIALFFLYGQS